MELRLRLRLSTNIQRGERIKTKKGWRKIKEVNGYGALVSDEYIKFGETIYGWKKR